MKQYQNKLDTYGLRDITDQSVGMSQVDPTAAQFTYLEHTLVVDTRDCIGTDSLNDTKQYLKFIGKRQAAYGTVVTTTGIGINPTIVTFNSVDDLKDGDVVIFKDVKGNTNVNGERTLSFVTPGPNTAVITAGPNGNYTGGGTWYRVADSGFPVLTDNDSIITENQMIINLEKKIKMIRSLTIFHIVIPRDIIPLLYWVPDFITASTDKVNTVYVTTSGDIINDFTTLIQQEGWYMTDNSIGFYSSPLYLWRTYTGTFEMHNQVTPTPLQLWNPPGPGIWPLQPTPYPYQTVPTYRCNSFTVTGKAGVFYLILSGYGVYDLVDWTINTGNPVADAAKTNDVRKLLLLLLCQPQSLNNVDYVDMILSCNLVSNTNVTQAYGFGDFQRYVPGPGIGQTYQPGSNSVYTLANGSGPPTVVQPDSPIPFPSFRGNVWGPYNAPGDRFQKLGLRDVVQDLYLNGDLNNLFGSPFIARDIPTEAFMQDPSYGLNFNALRVVNLENITKTTNPNILNAMRITANGFGTVSSRAIGGGALYTKVYNGYGVFGLGYPLGGGGIGPSSLGTPNAWVDNGIYSTAPGVGSFNDPIAEGPFAPGLSPATADASFSGSGTDPKFLQSYNDTGVNNGVFLSSIQNYINYCVNEIPDTDLIIRIEEARREERAQSTRSFNGDALLDVPIRLNLGTTSGTAQYIESLQSLVAQATGYWQKRYLNNKDNLSKLHLFLYSYDSKPIPIERMLQPREILDSLQLSIRILNALSIDKNFFKFSFSFDPLNPTLLGRTKRYMQIIFKSDVYQGAPVGLIPNSIIGDNMFKG